MRLKLTYCFAIILSLLGSCSAEMPGYYKTVDRVTWLVQDIDKVRPAWVALGLSDIQEYPNITLTGEYHGKPATIYAWEITGHLGNLMVEMIQPAEGQLNAFNDFLMKHGDGIFSIVHEVSSRKEMEREIKRMDSLGVGVLQQLTTKRQGAPITFTYFDTEPQGKFVLGLVYRPGGSSSSVPSSGAREMVSHLAPVIRESEPVSAFWQKLGFPAFRMDHAPPREDSRYRDQPLSLAFDVGYQHYDQFTYEWIIPPATPPNIYADFLKSHHEGIQHLGMPVDDLEKAVAAYERLGYHVRQSGAWGDIGKKGSGQYAYMDTDSRGGVSVELIHAY
jgi:catechol 2,3-dioxygenase-like lactoylglutathione lyase family enzyme